MSAGPIPQEHLEDMPPAWAFLLVAIISAGVVYGGIVLLAVLLSIIGG